MTAIFARTAGESAGTYTLSAVLIPPSVLGNYNITYNIASFVIAPLTVSLTPMPANETFGDNDATSLTTGTLSQGITTGSEVFFVRFCVPSVPLVFRSPSSWAKLPLSVT